MGAVGLGCLEHVVTLDDLDALTAFGLAQAALVRVEAVPALPGRVRHLLAFEELDDGVLVGVRGASEVDGILEEVRDGFVGVTLGVADEADGAALDPAGDVGGRHEPGCALGVVVGDDASGVVGDGRRTAAA